MMMLIVVIIVFFIFSAVYRLIYLCVSILQSPLPNHDIPTKRTNSGLSTYLYLIN